MARAIRLIVVYPWNDLTRKGSGASARTLTLIGLLADFVNSVVIFTSRQRAIFSKSPYDSVTVLSLGNHGMLIDLNPRYYIQMLHLAKMYVNIGHNIGVILTGPIGILGALFNRMLFKNQFMVIYDAHNVEKERVNSGALSTSNLFLKAITKLVLILSESLAVRCSDCVLSISYRDKRKFMETYEVAPEKIKVVYPSLSQASQKIPTHKSAALFHGTFKYLPNREAIETIIGISKKLPWVKFFIAGSGVPRKKQKNVEFLGFVNDLEEFFDKGDLAVIPLKRGAGVKMKVVDYLVRGIPVATTSVGAQGLKLTNWKNAVIISTSQGDFTEDFRQVVEFLMLNPKFKRKIGRLGYRHAKKIFSTTKNKINIKKCLEGFI